MTRRELEMRADRAGLILMDIPQLVAIADQDAGKVQATSLWLALIEAAARDAYYQLTGEPVTFPAGENHDH